MPYFQVDVNALDLFDQVAAMSRLSPGDVYRGFLRLWQYCWREKVARVQPERLRAFFPVEDLNGFVKAAKACEFLRDGPPDDPESLVVSGAEKRLGVLKARSEAGKKSAGNLKQYRNKPPAEPPGDPAENPEQTPGSAPGLTPIHPITHSSPSKQEGGGTPVAVPLPAMPDDRGASGPAYFAWVQHERYRAGYATEKPPPIAELGRWFSEIMGEVNGDVERVDAAYKAFAAKPYWRERNCPFRAFISEWRNFVPRKAVAR